MVKKVFFQLHKWLGLFTGLVIFIVSITNCIYVFTDELKDFFYHERMFIEPGHATQVQPLSLLKDKAQKALGENYMITRSEIYPAENRSWIFRATKTDHEGIGYWNYYKYYYRVYVNPYSGQIIHIEDTKNEFFQLVLSAHMNLLLGEYLGKPIVGYATLIFFFLLLSGMVLWWPTKWKLNQVKIGLMIKRKASFKRVNYDLHNVLGFYSLIPAIIITVTGLVFSFQWVDSSVRYLSNGAQQVSKRVVPKSTPGHSSPIEDRVVADLLKRYVDADLFSMRFREEKTAPIDVQVRLNRSSTHLFAWYYYDRSTGKLLMKYGHNDLKGGEKVRSMNFDLHVGSFAGMTTKILAFLCSLICASLPVTGFLVWYNKT